MVGAAQLPSVDDEIVAGENFLIGRDRIEIGGLRLNQIDRRIFERKNQKLARAHRQSWPHRFLGLNQNDGGFVNCGGPILREERGPDFGEFFDRHDLRDDLDLLDLVGQIRVR